MDERLAKALEFSNFRKSLQNQKEQMKLRAKNQLILSTAGGIFTVDRSLISFVKILMDAGYDGAVLLDNNENPIRIENLKKFYDDAFLIYFKVLNTYHENWEKIKKQRSVQGTIDW